MNNAHYAAEALSKMGIECVLQEDSAKGEKKFVLKVNEAFAERAVSTLNKIDFDETHNPDADGAIEGFNEWTDRMYNPGYYTGGRIPRFLLDKTNWKIFAPLYLGSGLVMFYFMLDAASDFLDAETWFWCGLYLLAGISMFWQLKRR